jgi:hypothetical protein
LVNVLAHEPRLWVENSEENKSHAAMMILHPKFDLGQEVNNEFLFLVDRSASMERGLPVLRKALLALLKEIPDYEQSRFNLITYGSRFESLFEDSLSCAKQFNVFSAKNFVHNIRADYGGTLLGDMILDY